VASQISASAASEVGWGQWLGQHSEVGDSFEAHQGGVARRRTLSVAAEEGWGCSPASDSRGGGGRGSTSWEGGWCAHGTREGTSWGGEWLE
jgi:hypothetical protein